MGQAMSLSELERCVNQAFSDQLLISQALFPSPYPRGCLLKCEVDVGSVSDLTGWQEGDSELIIQIVKTNRACCNWECSMTSEKGSNGIDIADGILEKEPFSLKCDMGDEDLKSFHADIDHSNKSRDSPYIHDNHQHFPAMVLSLIILQSPNIVLEDAAFNAVKNMLHQWVMLNKNISAPCHPPHRPSLFRDHLPSEPSRDHHNRASLFQTTRGKAIHPNVVPILGACKNNDTLFIVYPAAPFTLESILHFSPKVLDDDWDIRFLVYQLLSGTAFFHNQGIIHHDLRPSNILLTDKLWCWITGFCIDYSKNFRIGLVDPSITHQSSCMNVLERSSSETALNDVQLASRLWCKGKISNYDYLLVLNKLAGRRWRDRKFHIVMPWVIDFSMRPDKITDHGWRDLTKSKWRLAKGDEQLDFTYATAEIPHHVSDECLSELAVCIYKARRLPLFILRQSVRSVYEPNEYPVTLQRMYEWTPDECIPEFYSDASIFSSLHMGMSDLAVPSWASSAEDFIFWHREALEGKHVSDNLHHWIDLTFGYKLSGEAAIGAKNVTLSAANPMLPRSQGRRQLFALPHPRRRWEAGQQAYKFDDGMEHLIVSEDAVIMTNGSCTSAPPRQPLQATNLCAESNSYCPSASLEMLEETVSFCESLRNLSPFYISNVGVTSQVAQGEKSSTLSKTHSPSSTEDVPNLYTGENTEFRQWSLAELLQALKVDASSEGTFQDYMLWESRALCNGTLGEGTSSDIFALGCIIAELYLKRPLFDQMSFRDFSKHEIEPGALLQDLPANVQSIVRLMIDRNLSRRISAACLLESPFFPPTVRAVHTFISSLYSIGDQNSRLEFVARLASHGAFIIMGPLAAKKCISFCLSPLVLPCEKVLVHECIAFLTAALLALKPHDAKLMIIPVIQKLLQGEGNNELKVAFLQVSFIKKICKCIGINGYLKLVHPVVLSALQQSEDAELGVSASTLLIESCEELGVPITCSQTIYPLLQQFGRDLSIFAIDTVVGIGKRLNECLLVKHLVPSLRAMLSTCLSAIPKERSGPVRSWRMLVLRDTLMVLELLLDYLPSATVFSILVQEPHNVVESLLLDSGVDDTVQQHAAKALLSICQIIGPDATSGYILPRLEPLFAALAFSYLNVSKGDFRSHGSVSSSAGLDLTSDQKKPSADNENKGIIIDVGSDGLSSLEKSKNQLNLMHDLYVGLASLVGIERLRQCLCTWLILEQLLLKLHGWQWETGGQDSQEHSEKLEGASLPFAKAKGELSPTSLLLNEVGWSVPQPLLNGGRPLNKDKIKQFNAGIETGSSSYWRPWMWMPSSEDVLEDLDYLSKTGLMFSAAKDESPWKVKASVSHAWRAHPGPIKAVAIGDGETTIFTAGVGTKMRGLVRQWQLSTTLPIMDYTGHEEAVNDVCVLPWAQKAASCDGSIHLWDTQTGDCIAVFSEPSRNAVQSSSSYVPENSGPTITGSAATSGTAAPGGLSFAGLHGDHYTCMHILEMGQKLAAGTSNGHLRFVDLQSGQSLHLWQCGLEPSSPLVSAIASSEKQFSTHRGNGTPSAWIAVGFGLGLCKLFDSRAGNFMASWRAHEGFITKLATFEDHYLISSSLDKTLCLWDLRRTIPAQLQVFHGHSHGISSFEVWSNTLLSAGGNRIGISMLSHPMPEAKVWQTIKCHKLFSSDLSSLNLSSITAMNVLPFSRLFVVGSDDGFLRVCK